MTRKQPDPRFEVIINGRKACVAGLAGDGVVNVILGRVKRDPKRYPGKGKVRYSKAQWSREELDIHVGALDLGDGKDKHVEWLRRAIKAGDEIVIRVLGAGGIDKPKLWGLPKRKRVRAG